MTHYLQDTYFPALLDRRRPIQKILPPENEDPVKTENTWATVASLIAIALFIFGIQNYLGPVGNFSTYDIRHPGSFGAPLYQWVGLHRVAP